MGEWYVEEKCIDSTAQVILGTPSATLEPLSLVDPCCAAEPIYSCHVRNAIVTILCSPYLHLQSKFWLFLLVQRQAIETPMQRQQDP